MESISDFGHTQIGQISDFYPERAAKPEIWGYPLAPFQRLQRARYGRELHGGCDGDGHATASTRRPRLNDVRTTLAHSQCNGTQCSLPSARIAPSPSLRCLLSAEYRNTTLAIRLIRTIPTPFRRRQQPPSHSN